MTAQSSVNFKKFPRKDVRTLVALKDLGRGGNGKAWLCATVTQTYSAQCVLKFDSKSISDRHLQEEKNMWHLVYPMFRHMVKVEKWSGTLALVMPHFATVLDGERDKYAEEVKDVLTGI